MFGLLAIWIDAFALYQPCKCSYSCSYMYECRASYVTGNVESEDHLNVLHLIFGIVNIRRHTFDAKSLIHMFPIIVVLQVYSIM